MTATLIRVVAGIAAIVLVAAQGAHSQTAPAPPPPAASPAAPVFKQEELDQLLAPIALYPDPLLAQVLMAATYPLEIVQADRWARAPDHAQLKGDRLAAALEQQTWDPSVKSLVPFPQVLQMMSDKLDWTQKLGDAVLAQEQDVMASVQRLRQEAQSAGTLASTAQQTVTTEAQAIVIQPADPQVVYVPTYNPTVVYGTWPYPAYPPVYYPPPAAYYPYGSALAAGIGFAAGVAIVGSVWGWGNCNWRGGGGSINVNYNTYNSINRTNINSGRATQLPANNNNWQHQPSHRGGVAYRDPASRQNYQRASTTPASARQNFRGYDTGAGQGANRPAQGQGRPAQVANRPSQGAVGAGQGANRPSQGTARIGQARPGTGAISRPAAQPSAFSGMGNGRAVSAQADRGRASRQAASAPRSPAPAPRAAAGGGGGRGGGRGGRR